MNSMGNRPTRRSFLGTAAAAAVWTGGGVAGGRVAPSDRLNVALIGCGGRGRAVMRHHLEVPGVRVIGVCDVNEERLAQGLKDAGDAAVRTCRDYRRLLEDSDLDAVIVATNGHWHVLPTIHACQAGKDVYVEKPLGTSVAEGRAAVEAANRYGRVVQFGTQQRSWPHYRRAAEVVRSGRLGEISEVKVWDYDNFYPGFGSPPDGAPPPEFGEEYWDLWVGPSPKVPYNPNRFLRHYWFFDYGGGWQLDWAVHHYDVVHWFLGVRAPVSAMGMGGFMCFEETNTEWPDTFTGVCEYGPGPVAKKGFLLQYSFRGGCVRESRWYTAHGKTFFGSLASLTIDRGGYTVTAEAGGGRENPEVVERVDTDIYDHSLEHVRDFVEAVRGRRGLASDVAVGHDSTNPGHLMNIAWRLGRKVRWDAEAERIAGDPEADALLTKPYRAPWRLEV